MDHSFLKKCSRYSLAFIGFVVGTEILYNCIRHVCSLLQTKNPDENVYYKVIFFPDEGILCNLVDERTDSDLGESSSAQKQCGLCVRQSPEDKLPLNPDIRVCSCSKFANASTCRSGTAGIASDSDQNQNKGASSEGDYRCRILDPLCKSTALVHMVNVLDSARQSLSVCVYLITSSDLLDAIIRAKARGVKVRVVLDKGMSSVSSVSSLLKNSVPVRYSRPPQMMHNKFAVVDAPENIYDFVSVLPHLERKNVEGKICSEDLRSKFRDLPVLKADHCSQKVKHPSQQDKVHCKKNGVLMTGSFNWTWSGVVSNYENVVITNDLNLVSVYAKEFEKLWTLFRFSGSEI